MLISIAIPTYNNEATIKRAILSCLNQNYSYEYEILISDDGSSDKTLEIVKNIIEKHNNVRLLSNETSNNLWDNHNNCLINSKGDYVLFCHAGDQLFSHALQILRNKIESRFNLKKYILWGRSMYKDFSWRLKAYHHSFDQLVVGENAFQIFIDGGLTPSGTCYSRDSFLELGGFISDSKMVSPHSDSFSMIKAAFSGFSFEMTDQLYFKREQTSTLALYHFDIFKDSEVIEYINNLLFAKFDKNELRKILKESIFFKQTSAFYLSRSNKDFNKFAKRLAIKRVIKSPELLRNKFIREMIFSIYKGNKHEND